MKRTIILMISLFAVLCAHAGDDCDGKMKDAIKLLENKDYWNAKSLFVFCSKNCGSLYSYDDWIKKCDAGIIAVREQNRRKEELAKKELDAQEAKKRAEQRERDRLVFLSVYSDVPGKFSNMGNELRSDLLKKGVRFTNDSLRAYFYVRVAASIFEESSGDESRYRVYALAEVENAVESDYETKSYFTQGEGCCDSEINVVNSIYNSKNVHMYEEIENNIIRLLGVGNIHDSSGGGSTVTPKNVAIYVVDLSKKKLSVVTSLETRLKINFNNAGGAYHVLPRNEKLNKLLDEEYKYQGKHVKTGDRTTRGNAQGIDKLCFVTIDDINDVLRFTCSFIDFETEVEEGTASYPTSDRDIKITSFCNDVDKVYIVADELTRQLEIPSSNLKDLDKRIDEIKRNEAIEGKRIQDSLDRVRRKDIASSFVPGLYQLKKNNKLGGSLIIVGEALGIGSAIVSHNMRGIYIKKMNNTTNANLKKEYADRANACTIVRNVSIGAAAAVYVWNLVDAWSSIHKQKKNSLTKGTVCLNPTITDQSVALSLSINF